MSGDRVTLTYAFVNDERPKAYSVSVRIAGRRRENKGGGKISEIRQVWFPKSQCALRPDGHFEASRWILERKEAEIATEMEVAWVGIEIEEED